MPFDVVDKVSPSHYGASGAEIRKSEIGILAAVYAIRLSKV